MLKEVYYYNSQTQKLPESFVEWSKNWKMAVDVLTLSSTIPHYRLSRRRKELLESN
jgi:hypothetical protein